MSRYSFKEIARALGIVVLSAIGIGFGGRGAIAQNTIVPDNTLGAESSVVVPVGSTFDFITGGAERGNNLFHSFEQLDIGSATGALFLLESNTIGNVFARVSTQNASEIFGVLGTRQLAGGSLVPTPANLYLINPSGIIFGENATLDLGGSFTATTADSIAFADGTIFGSENSISLPNTLSVNPSAYLFSGQNVGNIYVQTNHLGSNSFGIDRGLSVALRENLNLIGGNILIDGLNSPVGAGLAARGGRINLIAMREGNASVLSNGVIAPSQDSIGSSITLNNSAILETSLDNDGDIFLSGQDIKLTSSVIRTGILRGSGTQSSQAGDVLIRANTLFLESGAQIDTSLNGTGNTGNVTIEAQRVVLTGSRIEGVNTDNPQEVVSAIRNTVSPTGVGNGDNRGNITIHASDVRISNGAGITASTLGRGNAGNISIFADSFLLSGESPESSRISSIQSTVEPFVRGNGGNISIRANRSISVENGAGLTAGTAGNGSVGTISLASGEIVFRGRDRRGFPSTADVRIRSMATTESSNQSMERNNAITVIANNLRLQDGAQLIASTESSGNSGNIFVEAQTVSISGLTVISDSPRLPAGMLANTTDGSSGKGGNITINAGSLTVEEGGAMSARSAGTGIAGNIVLNISDRLLIRDGDIDTVSTQTFGGDITINARAIILERDGDITTRAFNGQGAGGNIDITALRHIIALEDSDIIAASSQGQGGNISLKTPGFFGEDFTIASLEADPDVLDGNNSVDVNASGINDGNVEIPNTTSLENDLSNLPDTFIASDQLIANSCIVRSEDGQGTLIATGRDGLAANPRSELTISLPTGAVQAIAASTEAQPQPSEVSIVEPTGIYQMADGRWVMAQACL